VIRRVTQQQRAGTWGASHVRRMRPGRQRTSQSSGGFHSLSHSLGSCEASTRPRNQPPRAKLCGITVSRERSRKPFRGVFLRRGFESLPLRFFGSFWRCTCFAGEVGRCKRSAGRLQTRQPASTAVNACGDRSAIWIFIPSPFPRARSATFRTLAVAPPPTEARPAAGSMAGRFVPLRSTSNSDAPGGRFHERRERDLRAQDDCVSS
jgi:hypothetical protein